MKSKSFFLRLQLFTFVLLVIFLGSAAYLLPQKNHRDLTLALNKSFRTQYEVVHSIEQLQTSFYVYQRALTRWEETGSPLWAQLVPQSQAVVERQLDRLELQTQNDAVSSILSTVAQLQGQFASKDNQKFLSTLTSLEQTFNDSIQEHTTALSSISKQRIKDTRWALGICAGLMVVWGGLISIQAKRSKKEKFRIQNSEFKINEEKSQPCVDNTPRGVVDLVFPCHLQTYDFEEAAVAVFGEAGEGRPSSVVRRPSTEYGIRTTNDDEEENTEKTRLLDSEETTLAEDEVLKEVDEILAREIPGVDLQGAVERRPSSVVRRPSVEHGTRNTEYGIRNTNDVSLTAPAANDYPDVVIALHQEDFIRPRRMPPPPTNAEQLYAQTSRPEVKVVNGMGEDVITVDFDQERNDLAQRFKKKLRR